MLAGYTTQQQMIIMNGAGAAAGTAAFAWSGVSGFGGGFVAGVAGGAVGGFITGAGNAWTQGAGFGQGLFAGFGNGVKGAVMGGITGGLMGGLQAKMHNASFWDGYFEYTLTIGSSNEPFADAQAFYADYVKSGDAAERNTILADRMSTQYKFKVGKFNTNKLTTQVPNTKDWGLTADYKYVNSEGQVTGGMCIGHLGHPSSIYVAPYYATHPDINVFRAFAGHELLHAYHFYRFEGSFNESYSENAAYRYTFETLFDARYLSSIDFLFKSFKYEYNSAYRAPIWFKGYW